MGVVRKLADQNRTCIATIHQPSPEVFQLFDKVVLVSAGRLIYFGTSADVIPYFTQPALGYKYNGTQNPAEFMIDVSNGQIFPNDLKICRMPDELEIIYTRTKYFIPPAKTGSFGTRATADANSPYNSEYATTLLTHFKMLLQRAWLSTIRDKRDMQAQLFKNIGGKALQRN
jgi:ABC-type multidrug transport system ATPase subunit